jgi:hypothetical protein
MVYVLLLGGDKTLFKNHYDFRKIWSFSRISESKFIIFGLGKVYHKVDEYFEIFLKIVILTIFSKNNIILSNVCCQNYNVKIIKVFVSHF